MLKDSIAFLKWKTKVIEEIADEELFKRGWEVLVKELGIEDASRFMIATRVVDPNSLSYLDTLWRDKTISEIVEEIAKAKAEGKISHR